MRSDISQIIYNETDLDEGQADALAGLIADWVEGERYSSYEEIHNMQYIYMNLTTA